MSRRFERHHIVGSETHRPRPMIYLQGGWPRPRRRRRGPSPAPVLIVAGAAALLLLSAWILQA